MAATGRDDLVDLEIGLASVIDLVSCLAAPVTDRDDPVDLETGLASVIGLVSCLAAPAIGLDDPVARAIGLVSVTDLDARAIAPEDRATDLATDRDDLVVGISMSTVAGSMRILGTATTTSTSGIGRSVPTGGVAIRRDSDMPTTIPGVTVVFAPVAGGAGPRPAR